MKRRRWLAFLLCVALALTAVDATGFSAHAQQDISGGDVADDVDITDPGESDIPGDDAVIDDVDNEDTPGEEDAGAPGDEDAPPADDETIITVDDTESPECNTASPGDLVTVTFYDSDNETVLMSYKLPRTRTLYPMDPITGETTPVKNAHFQYSTNEDGTPVIPSYHCLRYVYHGYQVSRWNVDSTGYTAKQLYGEGSNTGYYMTEDCSFVASYKTEPYEYKLEYDLDGGKWSDSQVDLLKYSFNANDAFVVQEPTKDGYYFDGWYTDKEFTEPIKKIDQNSCFDSDFWDETGETEIKQLCLKLYAKFVQVPTLSLPLIESTKVVKLSSKSANIDLSIRPAAKGEPMELCITTDKTFKTKLSLVELAPNTDKITMENVPKGRTYYFSIRSYFDDPSGARHYSDYSIYSDDLGKAKGTKSKYGTTEVTASTSSGKISKIAIQEDKKTLLVEGTISKRLKSYDELYYLVRWDADNKIVEVARSLKKKSLSFSIPVTDEMLDQKFALAVKKSATSYTRVSATKYIINPEKMHSDPSLGVPDITDVTNQKVTKTNGNAIVTMKKVSGVTGIELCFSTSKDFSGNLSRIDLKPDDLEPGSQSNEGTYTLYKIPKKTYYFRARSFVKDDSAPDGRRYGDYGESKSRKMTYGVTEAAISSSAGKVKSVKLQEDKNTIVIETSISKRIKSYDDYYYLVTIDPVKSTCSQPLKSTLKATSSASTQTFTFEVPLKSGEDTNMIHKKFALAVQKSKGTYSRVSAGQFISNPEAASTLNMEFPKTATKKGIQGWDNYRDTSQNVHHGFINMCLDDVLVGGNIEYKYNGTTYYFRDPWSLLIADANRLGVTISGQVMLRWSDKCKDMIVSSGRKKGASPNGYYSINAQDKAAREKLEACLCFLAERYSTKDCHLDNWILGNEVNEYPIWYYAGGDSRSTFMKNYADTFRILYYSVKSNWDNARVYICTDHFWNDFNGGSYPVWGAKNFITSFDTAIKKQNKNIQWNLAYHPYPLTINYSEVWKDSSRDSYLCNNSDNTIVVSMCNLDVMTDFMSKKYKNARIILSEVGFSVSPSTDVQAAALAYSYYKAEFNPKIDSFMVHTANEYAMFPNVKTPADNYSYSGNTLTVFKKMNTSDYANATKKCLTTLGNKPNWKSVIGSKFDGNRFTDIQAK